MEGDDQSNTKTEVLAEKTKSEAANTRQGPKEEDIASQGHVVACLPRVLPFKLQVCSELKNKNPVGLHNNLRRHCILRTTAK